MNQNSACLGWTAELRHPYQIKNLNMNEEPTPQEQREILAVSLALSLYRLRDAMVNLSLLLKDYRSDLEATDGLQIQVVQQSEELIDKARLKLTSSEPPPNI